MKKFLLTVSTLVVLSGCASLPQESVTAQEKIGSGIETARTNQPLTNVKPLSRNFSQTAYGIIRRGQVALFVHQTLSGDHQ